MTIPTTAVSFSQLSAEVSAGTGTVRFPLAVPLNDTQIRAYCFDPGPLPASSSRSLSQTRGVTFAQFTIATPTSSYNIRSAMVAAGWPGSVRGIANVTVLEAVEVYAAGIQQSAMGDGSTPWPAPSSIDITLITNAVLGGRGGQGGNGGSAGGVGIPTAQWAAGQAGQNGGKGLALTTVTNLSIAGGAQIRGGGGGGGGGNGRRTPDPSSNGGGGGGGGGTAPSTTAAGGQGGVVFPGPPYPAGTVARPGQNGNPTTNQSGGGGSTLGGQPAPTRAGRGGDGGQAGAAGQAGASGSATPGTQGPGFGAGGAAGPSVQGWSYVTLVSGSPTQLIGPLNPV